MRMSEQLSLLEAKGLDKRTDRAAQLFADAEEDGGFDSAIAATAKRIKHASGEKLSSIVAFLHASLKKASGDRAKAFRKLLVAAEKRSS